MVYSLIPTIRETSSSVSPSHSLSHTDNSRPLSIISLLGVTRSLVRERLTHSFIIHVIRVDKKKRESDEREREGERESCRTVLRQQIVSELKSEIEWLSERKNGSTLGKKQA